MGSGELGVRSEELGVRRFLTPLFSNCFELSPGLNPEDSESLWLRRIKSPVTTPSSLTVKLGWAGSNCHYRTRLNRFSCAVTWSFTLKILRVEGYF